MSLILATSTLSQLPPSVRRPRYDRRSLKPGLVHIGVGGFFRAHQAVYADELLENGGDPQWAYCGVGLLPGDARMRDALRSQDCLYTMVERDGDANRPRVIGSVIDYLFAPDDPSAVIAKLAAPETKIISLTITEGGYHINRRTGGFDIDHPDVRYDLANSAQPRGIFGFLAEGLYQRMHSHGNPVTLMSCDNIQGNGSLLKRHLIAYAEARDPRLAKWIAAHCSFPNSMVDRITPGTNDADRAMVRDEIGIADQWPVMTETFTQWVLEDHFAAGRPAWEKCGIQFTDDVAAYEKIKLRILNGSHQALCYIGLLVGHTFVHEATGDPEIRQLVQSMLQDEVIPSLQAMPGMELGAYQVRVLERFANPAIRDPLFRISTYGTSGIPQFLLPSIEEQLKRGSIRHLAFVMASWFRALAGQDDHGKEIPSPDPGAPALREIARRARLDADAVFSGHDIFGPQLSQSEAFRGSMRTALQSFYRFGAKEALRRHLHSADSSAP